MNAALIADLQTLLQKSYLTPWTVMIALALVAATLFGVMSTLAAKRDGRSLRTPALVWALIFTGGVAASGLKMRYDESRATTDAQALAMLVQSHSALVGWDCDEEGVHDRPCPQSDSKVVIEAWVVAKPVTVFGKSLGRGSEIAKVELNLATAIKADSIIKSHGMVGFNPKTIPTTPAG
jgi:hypothetical protein